MVERLSNNKYKMTDYSYENLRSLNFKRIFSEPDLFCYKFVVDQYKNIPTLICTLTLDSTNGNIQIDVTSSNNNLYPAFYQDLNGFDEYIEKINNKIKYRLARLNIKKQKERKHGRKNNRNKSM